MSHKPLDGYLKEAHATLKNIGRVRLDPAECAVLMRCKQKTMQKDRCACIWVIFRPLAGPKESNRSTFPSLVTHAKQSETAKITAKKQDAFVQSQGVSKEHAQYLKLSWTSQKPTFLSVSAPTIWGVRKPGIVAAALVRPKSVPRRRKEKKNKLWYEHTKILTSWLVKAPTTCGARKPGIVAAALVSPNSVPWKISKIACFVVYIP